MSYLSYCILISSFKLEFESAFIISQVDVLSESSSVSNFFYSVFTAQIPAAAATSQPVKLLVVGVQDSDAALDKWEKDVKLVIEKKYDLHHNFYGPKFIILLVI